MLPESISLAQRALYASGAPPLAPLSAPDTWFFSLVRTKAAPLPGFTCKCSAQADGGWGSGTRGHTCCRQQRTQYAVRRAVHLNVYPGAEVVAGDGGRANLQRPAPRHLASALQPRPCWRGGRATQRVRLNSSDCCATQDPSAVAHTPSNNNSGEQAGHRGLCTAPNVRRCGAPTHHGYRHLYSGGLDTAHATCEGLALC